MSLVGESGSGKSTLARCLACLERPEAGEVWVSGRNLLALDAQELRHARRQIQIVFQGSAATLNPRFSALEIVAEPLAICRHLGKRNHRELALSLMESVGLSKQWADRWPSQFSGGQRQRLAIAQALDSSTNVIVFEE
jgi:ABC-type dipeptide/oligopeptide/nickel transport system ATPase subunit